MNNRFTIYLVLVCLFLMSRQNIQAGATGKSVLDSGSIRQQFDYVINKSSLYTEYRAVKNVWLIQLQKHVIDTLGSLRTNLAQTQKNLQILSVQTDSLKSDLEESRAKYQKALKEKNSISVLGISVSKYLYNTLVWILIAALIVVVISIYLAFKRSHVVTSRLKQDLIDLKDEYEAHRQRAREREEKMARQHLNEILKYKNEGPVNYTRK